MDQKLGWKKPGPETKIIAAEAQTVSVCMDRTNNSIAVLKDRLGMTEDQVIHLAVPDTQDNTMTTASQAIVAYPNVKKWLIVACNDNGVLGVVGIGTGGLPRRRHDWRGDQRPDCLRGIQEAGSDGVQGLRLRFLTRGCTAQPQSVNSTRRRPRASQFPRERSSTAA